MIKRLRLCTIAAFVILLAGCSGVKESRVYGPAVYSGDAYDIKVMGEEHSFRTMKENRLRIAIHDQSGEPVDAADVKVKLTMPGMFCGEVNAEVVRDPSGDYVAMAIPVMDGKWQAKVTVTTLAEKASPVLLYSFYSA